jgi:signal transduction histidine kinase
MLALDIVCLEDDAWDAELARHELLRTIEIRDWRAVSSRDAFARALAARPPDLILADFRLPGFDGREAMRIAQAACPAVPFIFLSGNLGEELAIETIKLGATDFVLKNRLAGLSPAVRRAVAEAQSIRERTSARAALAAQGALLKLIVDAIPDVIYALDRELKIIVANQALLQLLDRPSEAVLAHRMSEFDLPLSGDKHAGENEALMSSRRAVTDREAQWRDADDAPHWHLYSKLPLVDPGCGAVTGLLIVVRDVTESRLLEREVLEITEREQRRVGSDLHDGLGQELTGLGLMLKGLEAELQRDAPRYVPQVRNLNKILQDAFASAHSLAKALAPTNMDRGGVLVAIEQMADHCSTLFGIPCEAIGEPQIAATLTDSAASHLYRIAQEATANAAKHAKASRIVISLKRVETELDLTVVDDGIGFDAQDHRSQLGMGMRTMAYRARMLGGWLSATRGAKGGTRVECRFPIKQNQRAA